LAAVWSWGYKQSIVRYFFVPSFLLLNTIGLGLACFNNTQVGEVGPVAEIERDYSKALYIDRESLLSPSRIKEYFLRPPSRLVDIEQKVDIGSVEFQLKQFPELDAAAVLTSNLINYAELQVLANQSNSQVKCGELQTASSMVDYWLFKMNPKHNQRRRPTWYVVCVRQTGV